MKWKIHYSKTAEDFVDEHGIRDNVRNAFIHFFQKMQGKDVNIDLKKLSGDWKGFYRIRVGRVRILFEIDKENKKIFVERVDHRGDVYK